MLKKRIIWFRRFSSMAGELIAAFAVTVAGYTFILYFIKMLWRVYLETRASTHLRETNPLLFIAIEGVMRQNLMLFALQVSFCILTTALTAAVLCQLFFIKRWFYDSRGIIGRVALFGIPCAAASAFLIECSHINVSFVFCLLPALALFSYCFKFAGELIPGIEDIF